MKKLIPILMCCALLLGCANTAVESSPATETNPSADYPQVFQPTYDEVPFVSRFDTETAIVLSDDGISVNDGPQTDTVYTSHDIIYYEDRDTYDSGLPYGEGTQDDKHTAQEAASHTVVNITAPGAYRISGTLSAGQIRVDLGENAFCDENAVVELILDNANITCSVAPAVLFLSTYECDGQWSTDTAKAEVDTGSAGANIVLEGSNSISGSYVAKIFKDQEGEKKLFKQDGAIYSYMSMNVYGPGTLDLDAENEGLDTELHLTIYGGNINIRSGNDGINTNEDSVSVTTINAGNLHIIAGLGEEGDGIDSNGYLVINGGTVIAAANPAGDAGLDSDLGSYINGGLVAAFGSTMDWAESDSQQVTMNLQFSQNQSSGASLLLTYPDGTAVFAYDPGQDEILGQNVRQYMGAIISSPNLHAGHSYLLYLGSTVSGTEVGGVYDTVSITGFTGGSKMAYTGTDVGNVGGLGPAPGNIGPGVPEQQRPGEGENNGGPFPGGGERPEGMEMPEGMEVPMGGQPPADFQNGSVSQADADTNTLFYMADQVNAFSGIVPAQ